MALNIRNPEAEKLANDLAVLTGESKTEAVIKSLRDRLEIVKKQRQRRWRRARIDEIIKHFSSLPVLDDRSPEEMLYGEDGLPR